MKNLLIATLLLASLPALAADTFTMTVVSDVPGSSGTITRTYTMTQSDMNKFLTWIQATYLCTPQPNCTPLTLSQAGTAWFASVMQGTVDNVTNAGKVKAATDAAGAIVPINPQ